MQAFGSGHLDKRNDLLQDPIENTERIEVLFRNPIAFKSRFKFCFQVFTAGNFLHTDRVVETTIENKMQGNVGKLF